MLFWSGGKDSFLALRRLLADESDPEIILLTTFDASERRVANQDVDIASLVRQAAPLHSLHLPPRRQMEAAVDLTATDDEAEQENEQRLERRERLKRRRCDGRRVFRGRRGRQRLRGGRRDGRERRGRGRGPVRRVRAEHCHRNTARRRQ